MPTLGQTKGNGSKKSVCLMAPATTNVAAPTLATDGVPVYPSDSYLTDDGHMFRNRPARKSTLLIKGDVTAGQILVGTFTLWGHDSLIDAWFEIPLNGGTTVTPVALAETDSDVIRFQQSIDNLCHYDRVALQLSGIGGTGATFEAVLVTDWSA